MVRVVIKEYVFEADLKNFEFFTVVNCLKLFGVIKLFKGDILEFIDYFEGVTGASI